MALIAIESDDNPRTFESVTASYEETVRRVGNRLGELEKDGPIDYADWPDSLRALNTLAGQLYLELIELRPWTGFRTCTESATVYVEAGETRATAAFAAHLNDNPFAACGQCGDTVWSYVDVPELEPPDGVEVIDAAAVDRLLAAPAG